MTDDLLSIGEMARAGGLPVSALRFYDAAGVLRPAHVDPATGYRWYGAAQLHAARVVASLRQAGLPVADMIAVLAARRMPPRSWPGTGAGSRTTWPPPASTSTPRRTP